MTTTSTLTITPPLLQHPPPSSPQTLDLSSLDPRIHTLTKHGFLFGKKLAASMSPLLHDVVYQNLNLNWAQLRLDSDDIHLFLDLVQDPKFYGASITMPNKVSIIPHLNHLTPECLDIGACNTLYLRPDPSNPSRRLLCGANTDVIGIRESFLQNIPSPRTTYENRPAMVIGGGGAARSAIYTLHQYLSATKIYLVNRDPAEVSAVITECTSRGYGDKLLHVETVAQAEQLEGPGAIVACIPDLPPVTEGEKTVRRIIEVMLEKEHKGAMLEMCYNPSPFTALGRMAEGAGWRVILGTEAMIWQGIEQDKYWTGLEASELPVKEVKEAIAARLAELQKA
ncbi:hypothetical protein QBC40DRAFT_338932 [Triangularia verruculosa]|uniref:Shikimate dehydrogenase substrate binding N-terminal domain-containing protein n=1 Tax=Triangularia verruculosa TaxID=2587418 RepID=A0AAN6XJ50_9PEZI|nr:hypothetical protein QBC40DRAFT_338932 [Triangularia verruculosa]